MRRYMFWLYYVGISHNERKWRCYCVQIKYRTPWWPMSVNHSPPFFFTSFILNFHQFPLFFFKKYLIGKYLSSCIISPGVVRTSECVCAIGWRSSNARPSAANGSRAVLSRRDALLLLFCSASAERIGGEHKSHSSYHHDPASSNI